MSEIVLTHSNDNLSDRRAHFRVNHDFKFVSTVANSIRFNHLPGEECIDQEGKNERRGSLQRLLVSLTLLQEMVIFLSGVNMKGSNTWQSTAVVDCRAGSYNLATASLSCLAARRDEGVW